MPALRVLQVTPYYAEAWAYGGVPRAATALARGLARRGHKVTVCTTDAAEPAGRARGEAGADGVDVRVFPNVSNALAYHLQLFLPRGMDRWLAEHAADFDVAHLHACHNVPTARAARRLRAAGVPYVLSPHGTAPRIERRRALKWMFDHTVGRGVLEGAARLLAVSEAERRQLLALGAPAAAIEVVPNPVELADFIAIPRGRFRAARRLAGRRLVLFLGKLTPRKRVPASNRTSAVDPPLSLSWRRILTDAPRVGRARHPISSLRSAAGGRLGSVIVSSDPRAVSSRSARPPRAPRTSPTPRSGGSRSTRRTSRSRSRRPR